jgi:hypothetical protein
MPLLGVQKQAPHGFHHQRRADGVDVPAARYGCPPLGTETDNNPASMRLFDTVIEVAASPK